MRYVTTGTSSKSTYTASRGIITVYFINYVVDVLLRQRELQLYCHHLHSLTYTADNMLSNSSRRRLRLCESITNVQKVSKCVSAASGAVDYFMCFQVLSNQQSLNVQSPKRHLKLSFKVKRQQKTVIHKVGDTVTNIFFYPRSRLELVAEFVLCNRLQNASTAQHQPLNVNN